MSDYFATPRPGDAADWTPPPGESAVPAWSGDEPPAPPAGPWCADRPQPRLGPLVGAAAGAAAVLGLLGLLGELATQGDPQVAVAGLLAAVLAAGSWAAVGLAPTPASRAAAVTVLFVLIPAPVAIWLTLSGWGAKPVAAAFLAVAALGWAALLLTGPTRGRVVFLAGALTAGWLLFAVLAVDTDGGAEFVGTSTVTLSETPPDGDLGDDLGDDDGDGTPNSFDPDFFDPDRERVTVNDDGVPGLGPASLLPFFFGFGLTLTAVGIISLLFAAGYLAAAGWLDRRGVRGSATAFQGVGLSAALVAVVAVSDALDDAAPVLVLAVGAALMWLGATGQRRFTAWSGAVVAVSGVTGVAALVDDTVGAAVALLVIAAATLATHHVLGPADAELADEDHPSFA